MTELCAHSLGVRPHVLVYSHPLQLRGVRYALFVNLKERGKRWFRRLDGRNLVAIGKLFKLRICSLKEEKKIQIFVKCVQKKKIWDTILVYLYKIPFLFYPSSIRKPGW